LAGVADENGRRSVGTIILYMGLYTANMSKSIRVEEDTHTALSALKGEDETFDDLLSRLIEDRREVVEAGAGLWEGTDAAEKARTKRDEMKSGVGTDDPV
jgi:predicted CopG family antitoxin